jgi:hypothetical protein
VALTLAAALAHKLTGGGQILMSAYLQPADINCPPLHVGFGPIAAMPVPLQMFDQTVKLIAELPSGRAESVVFKGSAHASGRPTYENLRDIVDAVAMSRSHVISR